MKKINNSKDSEGVYNVDSDKLSYAYVKGTYSDQGCVTITFDEKVGQAWHKQHNHKGGDFKIHPAMIIEFLQKIGVTLHFETDRKHSYCRKIELKPWSEFAQALRHNEVNQSKDI